MRKQEAIRLAKDFRLGNRHRKAKLISKYNIRQATSPNTGRVKMGIRIDIENNPRDYIAALDDDGSLVFFTGNPIKRLASKELWDTPKARKESYINRKLVVAEKILKGEDTALIDSFINMYDFDINKFSIVEMKKEFAIFKSAKIKEATQYQLVAQKVDGKEVKSKFYDDENSLADMQKKIEDSEEYESAVVMKRIVGTDEETEDELEREIKKEATLHENFVKNLKAMPGEVKSQDKKSVSDLVSLIMKKANPKDIAKSFKKLTRAGKDYVMGVISTADRDPLLQKGKVLDTIVNEEYQINRAEKIDGRRKNFKEKLKSLEYRKQNELEELTLKRAKAVNPDTEVFVNFKDQTKRYVFAANNIKFPKGQGYIFHRPVTNRGKQLPIPGNFKTGAWVKIKHLPGLIIRDSMKSAGAANNRLLKKFLKAIPGFKINEDSIKESLTILNEAPFAGALPALGAAALKAGAKNRYVGLALFVVYFVSAGATKILDKGLFIKRKDEERGTETIVALGNAQTGDIYESVNINEVRMPAMKYVIYDKNTKEVYAASTTPFDKFKMDDVADDMKVNKSDLAMKKMRKGQEVGERLKEDSVNEIAVGAAAKGAAKIVGSGIATAVALKGTESALKKAEKKERMKKWKSRLRGARMQLKAAKTPSEKKLAKERISNLQRRIDDID